MRYQIRLGDDPQSDNTTGLDYGEWDVPTPEEAILAALRDADPTRHYECPVLVSASPSYGHGARRIDGNGAQSRGDWWYVSEHGAHVGIYTVAEETSNA